MSTPPEDEQLDEDRTSQCLSKSHLNPPYEASHPLSYCVNSLAEVLSDERSSVIMYDYDFNFEAVRIKLEDLRLKILQIEASSTENTAKPRPKRPLDTVIHDDLPGELKLAVLKEVVRSWATKVPAILADFDFMEHKDEDRLLSTLGPTNRAMLVHLPTGLKKGFEERNRYTNPLYTSIYHMPPCWVGWCMFPVGTDITSLGHETWESVLTNPAILEAQSYFPIPKLFDSVRISKILESVTFSRDFRRPLKNFLFGHITWAFQHKYYFFDMVENPKCHLPKDTLQSVKHICVEIDAWIEFTNLFEYVFQVLSGEANPLPNLKLLEIRGFHFDAKKINVQSDRVVDGKVRMRYLVTRCYQLVELLPRLTIVLSGENYNTWVKLDPKIYPPVNGHRVREWGWYTFEEEQNFLNAKSSARGPHLEIQIEVPTIFAVEKKANQWKLLFAEEWEKIWKLSLKAPDVEDSSMVDYYDAVYDPRITFNILEDDYVSDDFESDGE